MIALHYGRRNEPKRHVTTARDELWFGCDYESDIVLEDRDVGPRHCRLYREGDTWFVEDTGSGRGTMVNHATIDRPTALLAGYKLRLGEYDVELERLATDATEVALLATIELGDDQGRTIYADWLEQNGHPDRAEFLRLQRAARETDSRDPGFSGITARLRQLAGKVDVHWRMKVARPAIESCKVAKEFTCSMDWGRLATTEHPDIRTCGVCHQAVHYCTSEHSAERAVGRGHCVVLDLAAHRSYTTIDELIRHRLAGPPSPGMYVPATMPTRTCAACGTASPARIPMCGRCGKPF